MLTALMDTSLRASNSRATAEKARVTAQNIWASGPLRLHGRQGLGCFSFEKFGSAGNRKADFALRFNSLDRSAILFLYKRCAGC